PIANTSAPSATSVSTSAYPASMLSTTWSVSGSRDAAITSIPRWPLRRAAAMAGRFSRRGAALDPTAAPSVETSEHGQRRRGRLGGKRDVPELAAQALPVGQAPGDEPLERAGLVVIGVPVLDQEPGVGHDRIRVSALRVGQEQPQVLRQLGGVVGQRRLA